MKYLKIKNYSSSMLNGEDWGSCVVYLKFNDKNKAIAQMEFHANGKKLRYHLPIEQDEYSIINDTPLYNEQGDFLYKNCDSTFIAAELFNQLWAETLFGNQENDFADEFGAKE